MACLPDDNVDEGDEPELAFYCPWCAAAEFGAPPPPRLRDREWPPPPY